MPVLRLQVYSGLASRLRAVVGAMAYCEVTGKDLIVHWPFEDKSEDAGEFPCRMKDIWDHPFQEVNGGNSYWTASQNGDLADEGDVRFRTCHLCNWTDYFRRPIGEYAHQLTLTDEVADMVRTIETKFSRWQHPLVTVSIRAHNKQRETPRLPWFIDRMKELVKLQPAVTFFLSADCIETQAAMEQEFGGRVLCQRKTYLYDREGIMRWAADLYLLALGDWMVGSTRSSFSQMAAFMRGAERIDHLKSDTGSIIGGFYEDSRHPPKAGEVERALHVAGET